MSTDAGQRLIEDLREGARTGWLANRANTLMAAADEIERLRGVEADARRYRFLRECSPIRSDVSIHVQEGIYKDGYYIRDSWPSGNELDARLDELIAASRSTGAADKENDHG